VPVDSVEVHIAALQRRTFTSASGAFRFDDVRPGTYDLRARRIGFAPQVRRVSVDKDKGGSARFILLPVPYALPPVVTSSPRGGLSGVVGDTAFNPLPGAGVYAIGSGRRTVADSVGAFFLDVKADRYMVEVTLPGYGRKLLSVTVPRDSGRHITVWMTRSTATSGYRESVALEALRHRFMLRGATARFFTREDMGRLAAEWLSQLVVMGSGMPVPDDCEAVLDGWTRLPVRALTTDELESVEVYPLGSLPDVDGRRLRTRPPRSIDSRGTRGSAMGPACPAVFAWTRH
jgi:hypothetical protein